MADAATTLGKAADAARWTAIAEQGAASYTSLFFNNVTGLFRDVECGPDPFAPGAPGAPGALLSAASLPQFRSTAGAARRGWCHDAAVDMTLSVQTAQALPLELELLGNGGSGEAYGEGVASDRQRVGEALANDVLHGSWPGRTTTGLVS
jgi:hypothetical protein